MKRLWIIFGLVQVSGIILAIGGAMLVSFGIATIGAVLLFPGDLVATAFMKKTTVSIWVPLVDLLIIIPINAAFWYVFVRARLWKSN